MKTHLKASEYFEIEIIEDSFGRFGNELIIKFIF
jgi:hypothetical protein